MARVTVEDCVKKVPNRFELVLLASQRAKHIGAGEPAAVSRDNDKNSVIALREIAEGAVLPSDLDNLLVSGFQKYIPAREHFEADEDLKEVDAELSGEDLYADEVKTATSEVASSEAELIETGSFQVTDDLEEKP